MTTNIGIYLNDTTGMLSYYNEAEKSTGNSRYNGVQPYESAKINSMFEEVISIINGKIGCLCIYLNRNYGNEIRKKFVEEGLKCGFENVEIINYKTVLFLHTMSQINYKPLNGTVIWIESDYSFHVWKINDQKAEFIGGWYVDLSMLDDVANIVSQSKLNKGPDVVLYKYNIEKSNISKISSACQFFEYNVDDYWQSRGSLLKAQIIAGDSLLNHLNVLNFCHIKLH